MLFLALNKHQQLEVDCVLRSHLQYKQSLKHKIIHRHSFPVSVTTDVPPIVDTQLVT